MNRKQKELGIGGGVVLLLLICLICYLISSMPANRQPTPAPRPAIIDRDCTDFATQAEAQAWWEANGRPVDLDRDGNGVPCETLLPTATPEPPPTVEPTPTATQVVQATATSEPQAQPTQPAFVDNDQTCDDFTSRAEFEAWWNAVGRPERMDNDGDGIGCEVLK